MYMEIGQYGLTMELTYNKPPPIGANMMPMVRKRGITVLGVRMGLWLY
jgi:hypothetical protein